MISETVQLRSVRTRYCLSGPVGAPVVVFCNSLMTDLSMWDRVAPYLEGWRLLRYDMRGHGGSDAPPGDYSVADLAGDISELLDYLQLSQVHLVGISLGGMVAMKMAAQHPQKIASLTIGDTGTQLTPEMRAAWDARVRQARSGGLESIAEATLSRWFRADFLQREAEVVDAVRRMLLSVQPEGYAGCAASIRDLDIDDLPERLNLRTLVLHGRQDGAWSAADAAALAGRMRAELKFVEDAAHIPCIEQPQAYARSLLAFLKGLS